ncbi:small ribosomal subunit protein mL104 (rPPR9) [Elaeis guineensis]|uniref:LOW QUALITY PROTEIN: pentatricopeptide repeat-containing protein PNM1, mitochondrial n=1 Tax=Elaeis guineensis var. tenera TaxID=51953 RepID=A0A6I9S822_ELAGV|nr:LOW QUALITY PROTEIN: pentatricopeptide repeat-containing protein PNM1, mitochondrial [Elaeis guineensis]
MWRPPPHPSLLRPILRRFLPSSPSPPPHPPLLTAAARSLSSQFTAAASEASDDPSDLARSISAELVKLSATADPSSSHLDLPRHFSLHFSDVRFNTPLFHRVLDLSPTAGRAAIDLYRWIVRHRSFTATDESLSLLIHFLGRRRDFKAISELLSEFRRSAGPLSFSAAVDRLSRAGRPTQAVHLFDTLSRELGLHRDRPTLVALVVALTDHGFPSHAERAVKRYADEIFPDEEICTALIRGWSAAGKLDEARRLMGEMLRGGFELGTPAYNSILDCVCRLCRKKDPLRLKPEADKLLVEMEASGIPRDAETFRVLISNLCKIRQTEDAMKLFRTMGEWGCSPDAETYLALIRSLYQAARVSEGDEMIGFMRAAGFGDKLDIKAYYGFIKILCGIERVEHAMKVFRMMKGYGHAPGIKTYDLLMAKLAEHNQVDRANALFKEAAARGVPVVPKVYKVNPRYVKVKKVKKEKKRLTLPEKMAKKRRRLRKLRLSFVRKPKPRMLRRII